MRKTLKILSVVLCFLLILEQPGFAQTAGQMDISGCLAGRSIALTRTAFRPIHLRYLSYDAANNSFRLLLNKGDLEKIEAPEVRATTQKLLEFFFIGISLPNDSFWVNLRPDSPDTIIDPYLAKTDVGKILLEADILLKKDLARSTSPKNPQGREYWDRLYKKAAGLFGEERVILPTVTRPWIVPDEIIVREAGDNAYIYKATLKVRLEQDWLKEGAYADPRLKELNEYSSRLIRELIISRLTREINISGRYASLRQVYYSLILAQWFKRQFSGKNGFYSGLIDSRNLNGLASGKRWSKAGYFEEYRKSFCKGEYDERVPFGQTIRSYSSGGIAFGREIAGGIQRGLVHASTSGEAVFSGSRRAVAVAVRDGGNPGNVGVEDAAIEMDSGASVPAHWNKDWPLPTQEELSRARAILKIFIEGRRSQSPLGSFVTMSLMGTHISERCGTLRAIYYLEPDIAGAAMLVFNIHGAWAQLLDPFIESGDPPLIEMPIIIDMINRGTKAYKKRAEPSYQGKRIEAEWTSQGIAGVMGYIRFEMGQEILARIDADARFILVEAMVDFISGVKGMYIKYSNQIRDLLRQIPPEEINPLKGKFNKKAREFLVSIDKISFPEVPPLPVARKAEPRVAGKAVGTLVVLRAEVPDFYSLSDLPNDAIVAMSFLPTSDTRVGPFRGILTFRQEGSTSHAQSRARLWNVPHALWPGWESLEDFEGKKIVLEVAEEDVRIREATEKDLDDPRKDEEQAKVDFPEARLDGDEYYLGPGNPKLADPAEVGYKAALLNQLASRPPEVSVPGISAEVVTGSAFPFRAFRHLLEKSYILDDFNNLLGMLEGDDDKYIDYALWNLPGLIDHFQDGRDNFATPELWTQMMDCHAATLWEKGVFVRASTNVENLPANPGLGAGVYKTASNVIGDTEFWDAVRKVLRSAWSEQAFWERRKAGIDERKVFPAVWLVPAIPADYSFVIHTSSVATRQPGQAVIEVAQGLGESLVGNNPMFAGFPTRIIWDKHSGKVLRQSPSTKQRKSVLAELGGTITEEAKQEDEFLALPDAADLAKALAEVAEQTEAFFGKPQEIEGALTYDKESRQWKIHLLQTRFVEAPAPDALAQEKITPRKDGGQPQTNTGRTETNKPGGIDFRSLPAKNTPLTGMPAAMLNDAAYFPVDPEWKQIQDLVASGIIPSGQRVKEYLQSRCGHKELGREIVRALTCLADIMLIDEQHAAATDSGYTQMLTLLESGKTGNELRRELITIRFQTN